MLWFKTSSNVQKQLDELRERCELLERALKHIDIEWTNTYEKFRQLNMRVAKRQAALEAAEESSPQGEETRPGGEETASGFSPSQARAQQQVLARRNRNAVVRQNGEG